MLNDGHVRYLFITYSSMHSFIHSFIYWSIYLIRLDIWSALAGFSARDLSLASGCDGCNKACAWLTYCGWDKMAAIFRRWHFQMRFLQWKGLKFRLISLNFVLKGPIDDIQALVLLSTTVLSQTCIPWSSKSCTRKCCISSILIFLVYTWPKWSQEIRLQGCRSKIKSPRY